MKITYNWLKEFVDFNYTPQELAEHLTMTGLQVELVVPAKIPFSNVIVGKILEIAPHPNSKKLLLCKVDAGNEALQIVCGANNISAGDLVPTAAIGAILADNTNIAKRNVMGIDSYGMLCSEKELGLHDTSYGILILSKENTNGIVPKIGIPLEKAIGLEDTILDINVTPNRADALSIIGIAREVSAIAKKPIKIPKINFTENGPVTKELINIAVKSPKLCPRYTARIINNVRVKLSPFWMRYRLGLVGVRSINNIVDITNYVLVELGQPLHAFDYNTISPVRGRPADPLRLVEDEARGTVTTALRRSASNGVNNKQIIIRTAEEGEQITTIDNQPKTLDKDMLVIADKTRAIALAGVMGGKDSEVGNTTTDILIESAYFDPASIRKTSKKLGISTEASYRFERSIDYELQVIASDRASQLIQSIAGGIVSKRIIDIKKNLPKQPSIRISQDYCKKILGIDIPASKIVSLLKSIKCETKQSGKTIVVKPPTWRQDIQANIDLTEEIARLFGYTNIPSLMPEALINTPTRQEAYELTQKLYTLLTGMGLSEIISYSFIDPKDIFLLKMPESKTINLSNPIDKNACMMRTTLIPCIINNIIYNTHRGNDAVHIFELGRCYFPQDNQVMPKEELHLAIGICGNPKEVHWRKSQIIIDFFYLKGILEEILGKLSIKNYKLQKINNPTFCPGSACSVIINGIEIGKFGELHPQVVRNFDIKTNNIYISELNVSLLLDIMKNVQRDKFQQLPKFPSIRRDISIILDKTIQSYDIIKLVEGIGSDIIEDIKIFDVYEGSTIPEGKKSVAYAVFYRHKDKTLTDEEVDSIHNILRSKILETTKGEVRE